MAHIQVSLNPLKSVESIDLFSYKNEKTYIIKTAKMTKAKVYNKYIKSHD